MTKFNALYESMMTEAAESNAVEIKVDPKNERKVRDYLDKSGKIKGVRLWKWSSDKKPIYRFTSKSKDAVAKMIDDLKLEK